jgi:hypothetical protein
LEQEYKELEKELKSTKAERDKYKAEIDKIAGVRKKLAGATTGTPPGGAQKKESLSLKNLDIRQAFDNYDWNDSGSK